MKFRAPMYYKEFHCIADKCKDNCCSAGWEIDIDADTERFYKNVDSDFGNKLRSNISSNDTLENSSAHFVLDEKNNCPFLNQKKLCDIYINLGEEHLCQICKDHPRFYEWFDGIKECGVGLCCEEAARIILLQNRPFKTYEIDIPFEECDEYNDEIYDYLLKCRTKIIEYLDNDEISLTERIRNVLWYAYMTQLDLDSGLLDDEDIISVDTDETVDKKGVGDGMASIIDFFMTLEPNSDNWIPCLQRNLKLYKTTFENGILSEEARENLNIFEKKYHEINIYLKNIAIYFVWRYFLKGCFDGDVLSKIKLMTVSISVLKWLFYCHWLEYEDVNLLDCVEIVKSYSEEIEYSEDNMNSIFDAFCDLELFDVENLLKL